MVGYGQLICLPRGPQCEACPVSQYCPSAEIKKKKVVVKKQKKEEEITSVCIKQEPIDEASSVLDW
jgi:endonuclease-3